VVCHGIYRINNDGSRWRGTTGFRWRRCAWLGCNWRRGDIVGTPGKVNELIFVLKIGRQKIVVATFGACTYGRDCGPVEPFCAICWPFGGLVRPRALNDVRRRGWDMYGPIMITPIIKLVRASPAGRPILVSESVRIGPFGWGRGHQNEACPAGWGGGSTQRADEFIAHLVGMQVPTAKARCPAKNSGARHCCRQKISRGA
jgi:hypothetical protein